MVRPRGDKKIPKLFKRHGLENQAQVALALKEAGFFRDRSRAAVGSYLSKVETGRSYTSEELLAGITVVTNNDPGIVDYYASRMELGALEEIETSDIEFDEWLDGVYI